MDDRKTVYNQTVKTMVVLAKCLEELAARNEYTGDTTMSVYLDRAMVDLSKGLAAATLHVACYNEWEERTMVNDNATVKQVALSDRPLVEQIRIIRGNYCVGSGEFDALDEAADVVERHQREIGELKGERNGLLKANESFAADNTRLREENEKLRALVKELADSLNASCDCHLPCDGCKIADESKFDCPDKAWRALVARAREVVK